MSFVILMKFQKLVDENFRPPTEAYDMAMEADKYLNKDSFLLLYQSFSSPFYIEIPIYLDFRT